MKKMITKVQSVDSDGQVKRKGLGHAYIFLGGVNTMDFMGGLRVNREGSKGAGKLEVRVEGESAERDGWSWGWYLGSGWETSCHRNFL